ncbi:hypothetical protein BDW75DRAFT_246196 [Aspergillus navahoensis]
MAILTIPIEGILDGFVARGMGRKGMLELSAQVLVLEGLAGLVTEKIILQGSRYDLRRLAANSSWTEDRHEDTVLQSPGNRAGLYVIQR